MNEPTPQQQSNIAAEFEAEAPPVGLPWKVLVFSLFLLGLSIFLYVGLRFGYRGYLNSESERLEGELSKLSESVQREDREEFIKFYSQIANLKTVLDEHGFSGNAFHFLEKNTIIPIYFKSARFDGLDQKLELSGVARSYESLAQQIDIFSRQKEVINVQLGNADSGEDLSVNFSATLIFDPSLFEKPMQ